MKKTFECNRSMIITIPIGSLRDTGEGQLMPEKFHCLYKDSYKIFAVTGKPKPLAAAQAITGVFILTLGLGFSGVSESSYILPSAVFVVSGILSYAAGQSPNMHLTKLSFSLNIVSFFWSVAAVILCLITFHISPGVNSKDTKILEGLKGLMISLLIVEQLIAAILIYWLSKAVCRTHFNTLPVIMLKRGD
ncbi:uncharacterized protein AB9W97_017655 [Spinachia spinachia]